ncbi:MAG: Wzz/FepE/Etk N-terminal domain-containing protein [Candidatus Carbobacillus sp.]|nr:Wzz/FepE/Etk N-terminal domain-containing protein [Candidatus Carbobacillus sp.]
MGQESHHQRDDSRDDHRENVYRYDEDEIELIDLIRVLWKYRWFLIITPVVIAVIVYALSFLLPPTYESSAQFLLTNVDDPLYSNGEAVKALLLSRDRLLPLMQEFDLPYRTVASFRKALNVDVTNNIITIRFQYKNPDIAKTVLDRLIEPIRQESQRVYQEKRNLVESMRASLVSLQKETEESLNRNKAALTAIETQTGLTDVEKDISRARLLDYIVRDEYSLKDYISRIQEVDQRLLNMKASVLIEKPSLPRYPIAPKKSLNAVLGFIVTFMLAVLIVFIREYWLMHRDALNKKQTVQHALEQDDSGMSLGG